MEETNFDFVQQFGEQNRDTQMRCVILAIGELIRDAASLDEGQSSEALKHLNWVWELSGKTIRGIENLSQ